MLALHELPELNTFLIRLLATDTIIKTGVGVTEDIAQLARSYPAMQVFSIVYSLHIAEVFRPFIEVRLAAVNVLLPFPSWSESAEGVEAPHTHARKLG